MLHASSHSLALGCLRVFRVIRGSFRLGSESAIHESHETHEDTGKARITPIAQGTKYLMLKEFI